MQLFLLVIAHAGAMGHRGQAATRAALTGTYSWRNVTEDVALFVRQCLKCMCVGNGKVPRPLAYRVVDEVQEVPEASLARLRENAFI
ncbi:hypothetical protein DYB35_013400 [Aphanomyces astaci]|uniref:Integrase zinc-binding domain-containing protein n=1 Tax=Aphanomyces astaci TaxID=112090 RepID=A0A418DAR2_APHAT|nr:hypothetical protein DYB35_013400 [Aphanomyces astaci]